MTIVPQRVAQRNLRTAALVSSALLISVPMPICKYSMRFMGIVWKCSCVGLAV